jgi:hypothetical protein
MTKPTTQLECYRRMTPGQRLRVGCQLHDFAHARLVAMFRQQMPDRSEREILRLVAKRFLGDAGSVL